MFYEMNMNGNYGGGPSGASLRVNGRFMWKTVIEGSFSSNYRKDE